ncbi:hypothetical protein GCM10027190_05140 [Spirosoma areae]
MLAKTRPGEGEMTKSVVDGSNGTKVNTNSLFSPLKQKRLKRRVKPLRIEQAKQHSLTLKRICSAYTKTNK